MRLINTSTRKVEEFWRNVPKYAILSHTWDEKEITLQEMQQLAPEKLPGYEKIDRCCKVVAKEGFEYVWIDTCCIDKHSSSELSEAINSMYQWYKEAQVCITYLSDVLSADNPSRLLSSFKTCKWFKRGWTLQELIAPSMVEFYGRNEEGDWTEIGTKLSLQRAIFEATGIPIEVLKTGDVRDISVAKRMSWASRRETTREEDRGYSLMGLFDINMPMVYGEGKRAFVRLQEEIMKISNDHSLFAWKATKDAVRDWPNQGLLADSPSDFAQSHHIERFQASSSGAYQMTNLGLCMHLPIIEISGEQCAVLNCFEEARDDHLLGVGLRRIREGDERYARFDTTRMPQFNREDALATSRQTVYIRRNSHDFRREEHLKEIENPTIICHILVKISPSGKSDYKLLDTFPERQADGSVQVKTRRGNVVFGAYMLEKKHLEKFAVIIGRFEGRPWCDMVANIDQDLRKICRAHSYKGHSDRMSRSISDSASVSIAIKKRGPKLKDEKDNYDEGYTLYIDFSQALTEAPKD